MGPYLDLLRREQDFRRTYVAQLIALGGDWFAVIPLLVLLPQLTGTGVWGAAVLAVDTLVFALVGPYAGSTECPLEKWFRDAKIYELFEGTAEIQRLVISRMQAAEYSRRLKDAAEIATPPTESANGDVAKAAAAELASA